jgi:LacI family transcriptional regulator
MSPTQSKKSLPHPPASSERPTLMSVAKAVGCSVSTVSAVLAERPGSWASEQTRRRVLDAANALGYRPNVVARSLRGGRTQTLGLLTGALNIEITAAKVAAFEEAAREAGYVTMMAFSPNSPAMEDHLVAKMIDRSIDGLVVYPTETGDHTELRRLAERGFPLVTLEGAGRTDLACDDVIVDYRAAGRLQVQHMLEIGRRRLVQINTYPTCYTKDELRRGAVEAARKANIELRLADFEVPAAIGGLISDDICCHVGSILKDLRGKIDGLISTDHMAAAAIRCALELGIDVPGDLAIMGSDGSTISANCAIPLSTVAQPVEVIGRKLFELLQARIADPAKPGYDRVLVALDAGAEAGREPRVKRRRVSSPNLPC